MATAPKQRNAPQSKPTRTTTDRHIGSMKVSADGAARTAGSFIPERWRDAVAIVMLFGSLLFFFRGVLDSTHTFSAGDNQAFDALRPFLEQSKAQGDNTPQWIPNIFCGMPSFAFVITPERAYDLTHEIFDVVRSIPSALLPNPDVMPHIWHYFIFGVGMYLLLRATRNTSRLVALFAAFSAIFSTWIITYVMIGHNTKIFAIMTMPYIFMGIEKLRTPKLQWQRVVLWCAVLATSFHFLFEANHPQMAFYIFLAVLLYYVVSLVVELFSAHPVDSKPKRIGPLVRSGVLALLMVGLAFAMSADRYLTSLEYEPYSIRGAAPISDPSNPENKASANHATTASGGLDWTYATAWSFSPAEMITFVIPAYYGFGKMPYSGSELEQAQGKLIETYWGQMNGTDAANYTGIVVFFFAIIGILTLWRRERLVPPLAIISLVALLLSFGGNWSILFRPMFNYFPMFNKFRAPMMALVLMQLAFPILAALTFEEILRVWKLKNPEEDARLLGHFKRAMYIAGAFLVISLVGRSAITSNVHDGFMHSRTAGYYGQAASAIADFAASTAANDALICALLASGACVLVFFFLKRKTSPLIFGVGIFLLTIFDLWRVDTRPMNIVTREDYQSAFTPHDYIDYIKRDTSLYRVTDLTESNPSNALVSYGLQTAGGYHAAKMREIQDVVDETGNMQGNGIFNPFMWNLLNTKYIIAPGLISDDQARFRGAFQSREQPVTTEQGKPPQPIIVWENPQALPRAFFAYRYEVKPKLDILHAMHDGSFNPRDVLYFFDTPKDMPQLSTAPIDSSETVTSMQYHNEDVSFRTHTNGNRLLFMSDAWYPDWSATIDGKPTPIWRANYAFRAIAVPAGQHDVKFTYYDPQYATGSSVSLFTNVIGLLGFIVGSGSLYYMRKRKKPEVEVVPPEA
ncbi:MAG: YfhO family protein [Bacteroidota bacterium]|nr:YfhO family protein [Bacteroidota bacterium]MDP4233106.1 YfhO family protein [Bacteroidota bacterium]MDP4241749.1 YfhO family protein [Bacteroidota bacterium]MDP4287407.1 YfhO family protein [Bacteroidota bacterium]